MSKLKGTLYIVATPIGHLGDISLRAIEVLKQVDLIAAEDTRNSKVLLSHYTIVTPMTAYHEHNESNKAKQLLDKLEQGESIALISDAGTPLINDPGFTLVEQARALAINVVPIPGACAIIAALSCTGLATAKFSFEGFLPRTSGARKAIFELYVSQSNTLVFYESSHRILSCLEDIADVYEPSRKMAIARELTKTYETVVSKTVEEVLQVVQSDKNMQRGEFVVLIEGLDRKKSQEEALSDETLELITVLLTECSVKTAVKLALQISGASKKDIYKAALELNDKAN
ncbi:MAG: rRNA (cytidine-2'-O-)-methyltransferase [Cycloclasticus sp. symbiont of Poecilosclerida sp. M]|nr:MAG: rRNA (cytidine-2'-O-)-methyltransferase [Cycloclasticus sp. symbiont of Poecilosclerida sp. M]